MPARYQVVAMLSVREHCEDAFIAYEQKALAIAAKHGGRLEQRIVADTAPSAFTEAHVLSFPDSEKFAQYCADSALLALAPERAAAISATTVLSGREQLPFLTDAVPAPKVRGIDHVYLAVSNMARSEAYYDRVFGVLGFHKGNKAISAERHAHYFAPHLQISIRPAHRAVVHDPYAPGLHHLCMQVADHADVDAVFSAFHALGISASTPKLYPEYIADYYATFFDDPDGIRLEIVARTADRDTRVQRWGEFQTFLNPIADLEGKRSGIFHIATRASWDDAKRSGSYSSESLQTVGFIHCSMSSQVVQSANAYFREQRDLVLLQIDPSKLRAELRYEPPITLTPQIFPHLYGPLNCDAVVAEFELQPDASGHFTLPAALR